MKKIYLTFLFSISILAFCKAQWTDLGTGIQSPPRSIWSISAPNEDVVWAVCWDEINEQPSFEFTRTMNGGNIWLPGVIDIDSSEWLQNIFALNEQLAWIAVLNTDFDGGTIYKTINGGGNWIEQPTAYSGENDLPHAIHFFNENEGVTFGGYSYDSQTGGIKIFITEDGGDIWEEVATPMQLAQEGLDFDTGNGMYDVKGENIWFVTNKARVFKSANKGKTWDMFTTDLSIPNPFTYSGPCSIAFQDSLHGIVVSYAPSEATRTTDGGLTWDKISNFPTSINTFQIEYIPETKGTYLVHDGFNFDSPDFYITSNSGDDWEVLNTNHSMETIQFLSPTVGFGGGSFTNPDNGGMYKWESDILLDTINSAQEMEIQLLSIAPNPVSDFLTITFPTTINYFMAISIFDQQGRLMERQFNSEGQKIQVRTFPAGIYTLKAIVNDQIYVGKFMKQ